MTGMAYTDASESPIESVSDVIEHIRLGTRNRVTAATAANPDSSRSHAVFSTSRASLAAVRWWLTGDYSCQRLRA